MLYTEAITFTEFEIAWILGCLALGSILAATIGFGDALIIIPLLSLIMNPRSAIVFIGYWGLFMNIVNITKYRSFTEKKYIMPVVSGGIFGSILGAMLIVVIFFRYLEIGLGLIILLFVALQFKKKYTNWQLIQPNNAEIHNKDEIKESKCGDVVACSQPTHPNNEKNGNDIQPKILSWKILVPGGFLYAFLGSLLGASGPLNVMMLQSSGFKKERFIANFAACGLFLSIIKITVYTLLGLFPINNIWVLLAGYPVVYLSARIGHSIAARWSSEKFEIIVFCVLAVMALKFLF